MPAEKSAAFELPFKGMYPEELNIADRPGSWDALYVCRLPSGYIGHIWGPRLTELFVCVAKDNGESLKKQAHINNDDYLEAQYTKLTRDGPLAAIALLLEMEKRRVKEQGAQGSAHAEVPAADRRQQEEAGVEARLSEAS